MMPYEILSLMYLMKRIPYAPYGIFPYDPMETIPYDFMKRLKAFCFLMLRNLLSHVKKKQDCVMQCSVSQKLWVRFSFTLIQWE